MNELYRPYITREQAVSSRDVSRREERDGRDGEERDQRTDGRSFKVMNIEQQNKEPQNDEVITSKFLVRYSAVQTGNSSDEVNSVCFSPEFWILTPDSIPYVPCSTTSALCRAHRHIDSETPGLLFLFASVFKVVSIPSFRIH